MKDGEQFLHKQIVAKNFNALSKANIPTSYWNKKIDDFELFGDKEEIAINKKSLLAIRNYIDNIEINIESGRGLYIWGSTRVGKTMLASIILKEIGKKLFQINHKIKEIDEELYDTYKNSVYFIQATTLYKYFFRSTCSNKELSISQNINYQRAIVIDDIGKLEYANNDIKVFVLDDLIRYRQLNGLITIYTANLPLDQIRNICNESIYEIISETCEEITFVGKPYFRS